MMRFVQKFGAGCFVERGGRCYAEGCSRTAIGTWTHDATGKSPNLCGDHMVEFGAEAPPEGIEYAPTNAVMKGYFWNGHSAEKKPVLTHAAMNGRL